MKVLYVIVVMFWWGISAKAQVPSNCTAPSVLLNSYDADVKYLALQRIDSWNSAYQDSIEIPYSYQDTIWQGMAAIFNLTSLMARDSVFDLYCIHEYNGVYHSIVALVDPNTSWVQHWINGQTNTGVVAIDSFLSRYGLMLDGDAYLLGGSYWATLNTSQNLNVPALCSALDSFGIYGTPQSLVGDGSVITYMESGNNRIYHFILKFGDDCPEGCTSYDDFEFVVYADCSVYYAGSNELLALGDAFPPPVNCNITGINNINLHPSPIFVFPNPSTSTFNFSGVTPGSTIQVYNVLGEMIYSSVATSDNYRIDLNSEAKAIYFYRVTELSCQTTSSRPTTMQQGKIVLE